MVSHTDRPCRQRPEVDPRLVAHRSLGVEVLEIAGDACSLALEMEVGGLLHCHANQLVDHWQVDAGLLQTGASGAAACPLAEGRLLA